MKVLVLVILLLTNNLLFTQQKSKIDVDSSNANEISVTQMGVDSTQNSEVTVTNSDSNKVNVSQLPGNKTSKKGFWDNFWNFITNTTTLITLITLLTAGVLWKQISNLVRKIIPFKRQKQK